MPIINKFDGGHAEDIRTFATDESEKSLNFDIFTNPHKLIPFEDSVAETVVGVMDDIELDFVDISNIAGTYFLTATGYKSGASAVAEFYTKDGTDSASGFNPQADGPAGVYQKGSSAVYKDLMYALSLSGTTWSVLRYNGAGSVTAVGTISSAATSGFVRMFVHPQDNILYIIIGTTIATWDNTTFTTLTTLIPTGMLPTSMTDYGTYLAIGMSPLRGTGNSIVYLWGRDMTINTFQGVLDFGEGNLLILEDIDNNLVAIMTPRQVTVTGYATSTYKIIVKGYFGGSVVTIRTLYFTSLLTVQKLKVKNGGKLYFGAINDDCLYAVGKNKEGKYIITKDRYYNNGTAAVTFQGLAMIGDILWRGVTAVAGVYLFMRSKSTPTYVSTSTYKTTINPNMAIADRGKNKQLKAVRIYYTGKTSGTIAVKYLVDGLNSAGAATMESIISESTTAIEEMKQATMQADNQALNAGREIQFQLESTGGVEIKALEYEYDILNQ